MRTVLGVVLTIAATTLATCLTANNAKAQGYGAGPRQTYCASNDTRGTRCQMPWRDSVLVQQMSQAPCIEGQTWGRDPYSVWIKGGCRANFSDARAYARPGPGPSQEIYCASSDPRGGRCKVPWRRSILSRQMSDAACIEGRTWGSDPYSVWVRGGCRGQFRDARRAPPPPPRW